MAKFEVGNVVIVKSSGIARKVVEVLSNGEYVTAAGDHKRTMKEGNLQTREEYAAAYEASRAKVAKKFGRR